MEIATLKLILDVARFNSFAGAARANDIDPSKVSRVVAQVETALGARLFQRTTRRLTCTEAGDIFVARMSPIVEEFHRGVEALRGDHSRVAGTVRVTGSVAFGQRVLVPLLPGIRDRFPDLHVDLVLSDATLDLIEHRLDLAIRLGPLVPGDVAHAKLRDTRYRVCASPAYLGTAAPIDCPSDLVAHEALLFSLEEYRRRWLFRDGAAQVTEVPVHGRFVISSALALRDAAINGLGPALLADWLIDEDITAGRLVDIFPTHAVTATTFDTAAWLVYPSNTFQPRRVRALVDMLRAFGPQAGR